MKTRGDFVSIDLLDVLPEFERPPVKQDDETLQKSIEAGERSGQGGIQQPLAVLEKEDGRYLVVRGTRRRRIALGLGIPKVPIAIFETPTGETPESYAPRLRLILELRQDLLPSQRAGLIVQLKKQFKLQNQEVARYLGVDVDSITNWLAVLKFIPEIVEALDADRLTSQAARVFIGLSEKGQRAIWKAHQKSLTFRGAGRRHKPLLNDYPPDKFPDYYVNPEKALRKVKGSKSGAKKKSAPKPSYTQDEKRRLMNSYNFKEEELDAAKEELKSMNAQIRAATPIAAAIIRNKNLWKLVPETMKPELERFAELYVS